MTVNIGEIIYLLNPNPPKLIPGRIVEQIITRKLEGEDIKHVVDFSKGKTYLLEKLEKPWFKSVEDARSYLNDEAQRLINAVISQGTEKAEQLFGAGLTSTEPQQDDVFSDSHPIEIPSLSDSKIMVDLGDGKKASVILPEVLK